MTQAQLIGLAVLFLFGLIYDLLVDAAQRERGGGSFTAIFVILGLIVTLLVLYLDSANGIYSVEMWIALTFAHLAASGFCMTLGSWRRRNG
jgi:uncharacterized membrane protein HdeD (DUF308 family)